MVSLREKRSNFSKKLSIQMDFVKEALKIQSNKL